MYIQKTLLLFITLALVVIGYLLGARFGSSPKIESGALRVHGDKFTSPLLLTDFGNSNTTPLLEDSAQKIENIIIKYKKDSTLTDLSLFYRDLTDGEQININGNAKYFPASLGKVPLLMAYFKKSETEPEILSTRGVIDFDHDYNDGQEIKPSDSPVSGHEYSVNDLLSMMIKNSDNTGFHLLMGQPQAQSLLEEMFNDLQLSYPYAQTAVEDVATVIEFSRFFRLLYNATYLKEDLSERVLQLLSEVEYRNGIVAGVPNDVQVAHKFGLDSQRGAGMSEVVGRQLHDCGIIYKPKHPYLLCIMTKSGVGELVQAEKVVAEISKYVYDNLPAK